MYEHAFTADERAALARAGPGMVDEVALLRVTILRMVAAEPTEEALRSAYYEGLGRQISRLYQVLRAQGAVADDDRVRIEAVMARVNEHKRQRRAERAQTRARKQEEAG